MKIYNHIRSNDEGKTEMLHMARYYFRLLNKNTPDQHLMAIWSLCTTAQIMQWQKIRKLTGQCAQAQNK